MSREEALKKLGFGPNANPTKQELIRAHSEKIVALKDLPQKEKVDAIVELSLALGELRDYVPPSKPAKINISWLLVVGIALTLAITLATFLGVYWLMPASWGLSKVGTTLALTSIAATSTALFFTGIALGRTLLNKIATSQYDTILENGFGITGEMIHALKLGLKAKEWAPYIGCVKEWDTYTNPLAFRAALFYALHSNQTKIKEIENLPEVSLMRRTGPFLG